MWRKSIVATKNVDKLLKTEWTRLLLEDGMFDGDEDDASPDLGNLEDNCCS